MPEAASADAALIDGHEEAKKAEFTALGPRRPTRL